MLELLFISFFFLEFLRFFWKILYVPYIEIMKIKNKISFYEQARPYAWRHKGEKNSLHDLVTINNNEDTFKKYYILIQIRPN